MEPSFHRGPSRYPIRRDSYAPVRSASPEAGDISLLQSLAMEGKILSLLGPGWARSKERVPPRPMIDGIPNYIARLFWQGDSSRSQLEPAPAFAVPDAQGAYARPELLTGVSCRAEGHGVSCTAPAGAAFRSLGLATGHLWRRAFVV
jgi:hypothetical protein